MSLGSALSASALFMQMARSVAIALCLSLTPVLSLEQQPTSTKQILAEDEQVSVAVDETAHLDFLKRTTADESSSASSRLEGFVVTPKGRTEGLASTGSLAVATVCEYWQ